MLVDRARVVALASALCAVSSGAAAHAPQGRLAAFTPDAGAAAVAMPGFGILVRGQPSQPFAYVCDALLGDTPTDIEPSLAYLADGTLLMGTIDGVRIVEPSGCPSSNAAGALASSYVVALAVAGGSSQVAYAAIAKTKQGFYRSDDGGRSWSLRSPLSDAELVSAVLVSADDPNTVYVSSGTPQGHSHLLISSDGGASFTSIDQDLGLTLLALPRAPSTRFWAVARSADNTTNRGFDILHADALAGPWTAVQRVNYFGGFTADARGALFIGDEGGGLYRSDDDGDTFANVAPTAYSACLDYAGDALFACTPGSTTQPALTRTDNPGDAGVPEQVVAFGDVVQMVQCGSAVDVPTVCAAAWFEWRRDVLMQNVYGDAGAPGADAGTPVTGALDASTPGADASLAADASLDAGTSAPPPASKSSGGCAIGTGRNSGLSSLPWVLGTLALTLGRRRRARETRGA